MHEPARVVVLRHGRTAWNAEQRIQGQTDVGLDDTGRRQALQLALALADERFAAIYSSDLVRARETAAPLAAQAGLAVVIDSGLRERGFGAFEGRSHAEIEERWPEQALRWRRREPDFGPGGGEPLAAFYRRSVDTARRLASAHAGQAIALVTHGGVLDCLYRAAAGIGLQDARTWLLGNAAINRLLWTPQGFSVVGWGDRRHLDDDAVSGT